MDADTLRWINTLLNVAMFAALIWAVRAGRARARHHNQQIAQDFKRALEKLRDNHTEEQ